MKRSFFSGAVSILIVIFYVSPAVCRVITLEQALDTALKENPSVSAAAARIRQAAEAVRGAEASFYPSVEAYGAVAKNSMSRADYDDAFIETDKDYEVYSAGIAASWKLFDGFEREYALRSARLASSQQRLSLNDLKRTLCYSVAEAYFAAQLALKNKSIAESDRIFNLRQLEDAEIKREVGTGSLSDILNFKTKVNSAELAIEEALCQYNKSRAALNALLGIMESAAKLVEPAPLASEKHHEMEKPDIENFIRQGLENRPDLKSLILEIENADANIAIARADYYPSVFLNASVESQSRESSLDEDNISNSVSLEFSYPIFTGGQRRSQLARAVHEKAEAKKELLSLKTDVVSEIRKGCFEVILAQNKLKIQRENVAIARKNRDLVREAYNAGKASLVRLNEAQRDLTTAMEQLAQSLVSLKQAWLELKTRAGVLL